MGLLFISAPSALRFTRASSAVHLFRFSPYRRLCGGVSFAFASEPEPISDHLQVHKECKHLRHEGLRNNELYYSVFNKYHAAGALGYGSVMMPDENPSYFDFDASMDNSAYRPILEEDGTPTTGARNLNNM
ncbi:hypothetical protein TIFTF001_026091 [Ficus carica]|uniref:Uncharacterized protein n=1 Tax=Ficus carica TaxID=3494 RepID=A0AA88DKP4_FICCA|nr:hypothetical protein TIFTF001_026091 [Ficus carica]